MASYYQLLPIVVAAALWGPSWVRIHVRFYSDNEALSQLSANSAQKIYVGYSLICCAVCSFMRQYINFIFRPLISQGSLIGWQMQSESHEIIYHLFPLSFHRVPNHGATVHSPVPHGSPGLGISQLDGTIRSLASLGLSPSTNSSYRSGVRRYQAFCTRY